MLMSDSSLAVVADGRSDDTGGVPHFPSVEGDETCHAMIRREVATCGMSEHVGCPLRI